MASFGLWVSNSVCSCVSLVDSRVSVACSLL